MCHVIAASRNGHPLAFLTLDGRLTHRRGRAAHYANSLGACEDRELFRRLYPTWNLTVLPVVRDLQAA